MLGFHEVAAFTFLVFVRHGEDGGRTTCGHDQRIGFARMTLLCWPAKIKKLPAEVSLGATVERYVGSGRAAGSGRHCFGCIASKLSHGLHAAWLGRQALRRADAFQARCLRRILGFLHETPVTCLMMIF